MFEYMGWVRNFTFIGVPWLEKVHLRFMFGFDKSTNYMFNGLAKDLPRLQILSLVLTTHELRPIPANMTKFSHLKELELFVFISTDFDLLSITFILNASPLLQKFHLAIHRGHSKGQIQKRECSKHLYYQLKEVEISGFCDRWNAMELAIYLLNNAVALDRMIVNSKRRLYHGGGRWSYFRNFSFMDELERKRVHDVLSKEKVNPSAQLIVL